MFVIILYYCYNKLHISNCIIKVINVLRNHWFNLNVCTLATLIIIIIIIREYIFTGIFSVKMNENHNCELYLVGKLDHEANSEYILKLQLESTSPLGPNSRTSTQVI